MNCKLCRHELEAYREGRLPEGIRTQVNAHLESCTECAVVYTAEILAEKVMEEEKTVRSNPFLATRVMAGIEALESSRAGIEPVPVYRKVLKPVLISFFIAAAILIGVLAGNVYQPAPHQNIPVELSYMNDAALESVNLLATK